MIKFYKLRKKYTHTGRFLLKLLYVNSIALCLPTLSPSSCETNFNNNCRLKSAEKNNSKRLFPRRGPLVVKAKDNVVIKLKMALKRGVI